jgi:hypothetical protein
MNPKLTLGQRLMADTPDFFKKSHIVGLVLILAAAVLNHFNMPIQVVTIVATVGGSITAFSQLPVKDITAIESQGVSMTNVLTLITDLSGKIEEVKGIVAKPASPPSLADAAAALNDSLRGPDKEPASLISDAAPAAPLSVVTD